MATLEGKLKFSSAEIKRIISVEIDHRFGIKVAADDVWLGLTHQGADACSVEASIQLDRAEIQSR